MRARAALLLAALGMAPGAVARAPAIRVAAIHWPGPDGRELHGMMAIPAKAHGRQPAVLVLGRGTMPQGFAWHAAERIAAAGLIACALDAAPAEAFDDAGATIRWLATNRYASGKVGLVGIGATAPLARRIGADRPVVALAYVDAGDGGPAADGPPSITVASSLSGDPLAARDEALDRAALFLKEHLR